MRKLQLVAFIDNNIFDPNYLFLSSLTLDNHS